MKTAARDYHSYVIKDGQFIGDFENMYQDCEDPWGQSSQPNRHARYSGILFLQEIGAKTVLECGCGLGYYADWIYRETGIIPKSIDLSETAIQKAQALFPALDFEVADISKELGKYKEHDVVLLSEIIWYILPSLGNILDELKTNFKGKHLMVNQVFYKGTQKYGTEFFTSMREFIDYIPFPCVAYTESTYDHESTIGTTMLFKIS